MKNDLQNLYEWFPQELQLVATTSYAERLAAYLRLTYIPEAKEGNVCFVNNNEDLRDEFKQTFTYRDLSAYLYAVIHSPFYKAYLEEGSYISLDGMPYPKDDSAFWRLVKLAERIMALHRLSGITKDMFITSFPVAGDNLVNDPGFVSGRVYINQVQYFDNVPETTWNFISGNIQPAQKWLLLRKGNSLTAVDIEHYQKMIVAITETVRLISKIHEGEFKTSF